MAITTRGEKHTIDHSMPTEVEYVKEPKDTKVKDVEKPKDQFGKKKEATQNIILMPRPPYLFP